MLLSSDGSVYPEPGLQVPRIIPLLHGTLFITWAWVPGSITNKCILFSFQAIPEASISWKYKETDINNGSTLVNDIDMRYYFYIETGFGSNRKSELFLSATSVDDNGTFACIAENKAGKARAEFKLHVVVPMPPKPPQVITYINTQEFYIQ